MEQSQLYENNRPSSPFRGDPKILELIQEALSDEMKQVSHFERFMSRTKKTDVKEIIRQMRMDEQKHIKILSNIYLAIAGTTPTRHIAIMPSDIMTLVDYEKMIFLKLQTVEFYRKIYFACTDQAQRDMFYEMITDEQNHAAKFTYLYAKNMFHPDF